MFKLEFETDLNSDNHTSSSNPPRPPAKDGSSGRDRKTSISEASVGFIGGLRRDGDTHGLGRNDSKRRNDNQRWNHNDKSDRDNFRENLRYIAHSTLQTLDEGEYFPPGQDGPYDLKAKILRTNEKTRYYGPGAGEDGEILESEFVKINKEGGGGGNEERNKDGNTGAGKKASNASYHLNEESGKATASKPDDDDNANPKNRTRVQATSSPDPPKKATLRLDNAQTPIYVGEYSTLVGARKAYLALARNTDPSVNKKIGVLNFASAKRPGGGFIVGCQAQEESLARASTLYSSLITEVASQFYKRYHEDPDNAYYTHAMVYSPGVVLIRDDNGEWRSPVEVDVLTSAAVNAGEVRRELEREERLRKRRVEMEYWKKWEEDRRKEKEKATAERQRRKEEAKNENEKEIAKLKEHVNLVKKRETDQGKGKDSGNEKAERKEETKNEKEKEEIAKLKKEHANLVKLRKEMDKKRETDLWKGKDSGIEKSELFVEDEKGEEVDVERPEGNQGNTVDNPDCVLECVSDSQLKGAREDDQAQPEALPKVNQESISSSTIVHPLSPPNQPSQALEPEPNLTYVLALESAEVLIQQTMYARISRILHLFQLHKVPHLILGSFGTGVFKNHIELIATIFADLLIKPGGRFKDVFQKVVFAILGKETVRVFTEVFSRIDKRAQRERTGKTCVFEDWYGSGGGDVKEGDEEKAMRMMRWEARRRKRRNSFKYVIPDDAADDVTSFDPAQVDAACHPLSFDAAQASAVPYPTSAAAAVDAASHPPSFDAAQTDAANPTATKYYAIPEDAKMILKRGDEQVGFVAKASANAPITPKTMVVDGGKDIDKVEIKSLPTGSREAQNSGSDKKEDAFVESLRQQDITIDPKRLRLRDIAQGTIKAINDGYVDSLDSKMRPTRNIIRQSADDTARGTEYFEPDTPWLGSWWKGPLLGAAESHGKRSRVAVQIIKMSTLQGAHSLSQTRPASKIGVLNFASATQPGGKFMNGASAQEESIARSSTLYLSLQSRKATPFYELHDRDNGGGYYSHSMIYSSPVAVFRDDDGDWLCPYYVDIVTSSAVNADLVRKLAYGCHGIWPVTEERILSVMIERMGRILALFERSGVRNLVLGSFGAGILQNDVGSLAKIWGELLGVPGARFAYSFDQVIFAIPDSDTRRNFRTGFNTAHQPRREFGPQNLRSKDGDIESPQDIAQGTIKAIKDGYVDILDSNMRPTRYNIRQSADDTVRGTKFYDPDSPRLKWWQVPAGGVAAEQHGKQSGFRVAIQILNMSTLQGAHFFSQTRRASPEIGVLNFGSATKPGGGFLNGASTQEESIARSSTLHLSLQSRRATPFYELHDRDNRGGYYSHSMIYSPSVAIFRDDNGDWLCPYHVDIVTSSAVNAGLVRKLSYGTDRWPDTEGKILSVMRERMERILALFERSGVRNLVLGSFGPGVFQNDVGSLAKIWGELLGAPGTRFSDSFDQVIFAIPDSYTRRKFGTGFNAGASPPQIWLPRM